MVLYGQSWILMLTLASWNLSTQISNLWKWWSRAFSQARIWLQTPDTAASSCLGSQWGVTAATKAWKGDRASSALSLQKHLWDVQGMLLVCLSSISCAYLFYLIHWSSRTLRFSVVKQIHLGRWSVIFSYASLINFFRLSKDCHDSNLYLAHCKLASCCVNAGHEMISLSLPISLVMKLGSKRQGQGAWLDPSAEHLRQARQSTMCWWCLC